MQIEIDFTESELENLKCKIDKLDPITQAEKVMEYLDGNYTQKQLGEKLGKTRDWIAKRVQFIRALEKLPKSEQKEVKELVRHRTISMDVVILIVDLPKEQRREILSKHPTVAEARRLIDELNQNKSTTAKLSLLERNKSRAYSEIELMFNKEIFHLSSVKTECSGFISSNLDQKITNFIKYNWAENYRFGLKPNIGANAMNEEMTRCRIVWLEKPGNVRIKELRKRIEDCHNLCINIVEELESQAQQVPSLMNTITSLRLQLEMLKMGDRKDTGGFFINCGNGIPPLELNIAGDDQLKAFYRALSKAFHPDKHQEDRQQYEEIMKSINVWHGQVRGKM